MNISYSRNVSAPYVAITSSGFTTFFSDLDIFSTDSLNSSPVCLWRGVYVGYDQIDFREDGAYHKQTSEKLSESVEKMSKSLKNVVNPDKVIGQYGADTFRLYEMFMGPLEASKPWNTRDVPGVHRFCHRVWRMIAGTDEQPALLTRDQADEQVERTLHKTIRKVGEDIEALSYNTAIAALMECMNEMRTASGVSAFAREAFCPMLAPFCPHLAEEIWSGPLGRRPSVMDSEWPTYDPALCVEDTVEIAVQVNGKVRGRATLPRDADEATARAAALAAPNVAPHIEGKDVVKFIHVPNRLANIIVK